MTTTKHPWWLRHGRFIGLGLIAAGVVLALGACIGVQRATYLPNELAYIATGGITGVFCSVTGAALVVATELGCSRRRLDRLVDHEAPAGPAALATGPAGAPAEAVVDLVERPEPHLVARSPR